MKILSFMIFGFHLCLRSRHCKGSTFELLPLACTWWSLSGNFLLGNLRLPSTPLHYPTFWEASPANRVPVLGLGSQPDLGLLQPGELAKPIGAQCQSQATGKWACRPLMVQAAAGKTPPLPTISPGPGTHVHICLHLHIFAKTTNFLPTPTDPPTTNRRNQPTL